MRQGQFRRRTRLAIAGAAILLFSGGLLGTVILQEIDTQHYKPVWWLRWEANGANAVTSEAALVELDRRMDNQRLTPTEMSLLAQDALAMQADLGRPWHEKWGELFEQARATGAVSDADWSSYAMQAALSGLTFEVRPKVRHGDPIPFRSQRSGSRIGPHERFYVNVKTLETEVAGIKRKGGNGYGGSLSANSRGSSSSAIQLQEDQWERVPVGAATFTQRVALEVRDSHGSGSKLLASKEETRVRTFKVMPADHQPVRFTNDPSLAQQVKQSLSAQPLRVRKSYRDGLELMARISLNEPPVDVAFKVTAKVGDQSWEIGSVKCRAGKSTTYHTSGHGIMGFAADQADLILTPSLEEAARTVDQVKIWGEPVTLKDVKVDWQVPKP